MTLPKAPDALIKAKRLANILDTAITIPVIRFKVGLDFLVGLIPGLGDGVMLLTSLMMLRYANQMGAPKQIKTLMIRNSLLDFALGLVPVVGDIIDVFFKANRANAKLLESWWLKQNQRDINQFTQQQLQDWDSRS